MMIARFVESLFGRITVLQAKRPMLVVLLALLTILPAWGLARNLELRTGFGELLPEKQPSVLELRRSAERLPSMSTLAVTAESQDTELLKRFMVELTPELRKLPMVTDVETGPRDVQEFFSEHKYLYAELKDIEQLHEDVTARYDWEVGKKLGTNLDDEDAPPPVTAESVRQRFQHSLDDLKKQAKGVDGYYIGEEGTFAVILVRTPLGSMDQRAFDLQQRISELIDKGPWVKQDPKFRYGFTGNLVTSAEEYRDVSQDLTEIGAMGIGLVLLVVYFFFFRVRVLIALAVSIGLGCLWCFAFAELSVGHLNTATGFLVSVVAGNGINAMVIYMARFMEARRIEKLDTAEALRTATLTTYSATLAAVGVAMVSYGALMTTEFRGFRHFGIIGAAGMFLCWLATYLVLPAVLVLCDRVKPFTTRRWIDDLSGAYGRPFIWVAKRFMRPVAILGALSAVLAVGATLAYFGGDPNEYDLKNIRNQRKEVTSAGALSSRMGKVVSRMNQSGRAVLVDRLDQVEPLVKTLEARRDAAPDGQKPFGEVISIYSLIPKEQEKKLELLGEIVDRVTRARQRGFIAEAEWKELEPHLPAELSPIEIKDLPAPVARPFEERDGTRGKIVYVAPSAGRSTNDAHYLMQWADSFREVKLPSGETVLASGDAVVFSDMLRVIARDAPRVALLSFLGTVLVILLSFRGRLGGVIALFALLLGVSWMIAILYIFDVKLNFLNFMALPIAIGVGSDYAINVMKRREIEGDEGIERAFTETGGAVVACSMTTLSGYIALLFSVNGAVRSLGLTAGLGEVCTQLAAMLVLPASLYWLTEWKQRRARSERAEEAGGESAAEPALVSATRTSADASDVSENV